MSNKLIYGYARVSTADQNLERQITALLNYGIEERNIITDKQSGKDFNRLGYIALKDKLLRNGDTLVIKELDRLGRNYEEIKKEWNDIINKGVEIVIIDMPILSTAEKSDLEKTLICNIVFELLAYSAEKERIKILQRQQEGIAQAKKKGVHMGRPKIITPDNFDKEYVLWKSGIQTAAETMKKLNLKPNTFYRLAKENKDKY